MSAPSLIAAAEDGLAPAPLYKPSSRSPVALDISLDAYGASSFATEALNLGEVAPDFNLPQVDGGHCRLSDEDQSIMKEYGVRNSDTKELALHAVFILDEDRKGFYRKVASRRPVSQELLDAINYHYGTYPLGDEALVRGDILRGYRELAVAGS